MAILKQPKTGNGEHEYLEGNSPFVIMFRL
jgi:hypothetical protein